MALPINIEEVVLNALYHRDYQEREPMEITIEPTHIDILSYAGPDRSIKCGGDKGGAQTKGTKIQKPAFGVIS